VLGAALSGAVLLLAHQVAIGAQGQGPSPPTPTAPKLVVMLVADQFRSDYITMYGDGWTGGLKEILAKGALFTDAAYPYFVTRTCAGHSTLGTGLLPSSHGMIDNTWYDRATHEFVNCTEDRRAKVLTFGGGDSDEHHSAKWLLAPTYADELKRQLPGRPRVVTLSLKARSAIGLGGQGGPNTTMVWKDEDGAVLATSDAFGKRRPAEVEAYVRSHPITPEQVATWDRVRPAGDYKNADQAPGEPAGRQTFPHLFDEPVRLSDTTPELLDSWDNTPAADAYLEGLATHLIDRERLGQREATDFLGISFSVLDIVGHDYGPRSHEVQDVLFRLDAILARLIATLDARVGRSRYVLVFSSDHGVAALPEQAFPAPAAGRGGAPAGVTGRLTNASIGNAIEAALDKLFGRGTYVEALSSPYIYFKPGVLDRVRANPAAVQAVESSAKGVRGVSAVYWSADIASTSPTTDPVLTALRKSYYPGRSGDLALVLERNWVNSAGTAHGTPQDYDQRVPLIFFGAGVAPGRYSGAATPIDVVPTLAELTGVRMPRTDGRILREALAEQGSRSRPSAR
jgi:predicted AlkP superfamily pyrophosphatase or phosphodiesterase